MIVILFLQDHRSLITQSRPELLQSRQPAVRATRLSGSPSLFGGIRDPIPFLQRRCDDRRHRHVANRRLVRHYECKTKRKKWRGAPGKFGPVAEERASWTPAPPNSATTGGSAACFRAPRSGGYGRKPQNSHRSPLLRREATEAQSALDQLYNLVEAVVSAVRANRLEEQLSNWSKARPCGPRRDRAPRAAQPAGRQSGRNRALTQRDLREKLTTGEVSAHAPGSARSSTHVVSDDKIQVFGRNPFPAADQAGIQSGPPVRASVQEWCPGRDHFANHRHCDFPGRMLTQLQSYLSAPSQKQRACEPQKAATRRRSAKVAPKPTAVGVMAAAGSILVAAARRSSAVPHRPRRATPGSA